MKLSLKGLNFLATKIDVSENILTITLNRPEKKNALSEFLSTYNIVVDDFREMLRKKKISWRSFENYINSRALWKKSLLQKYGKKAIISDYDLNLPFKKIPSDQTEVVDLSEIIIPFAPEQKSKALLLANRLKVELDAGSDFSNAARRFSRAQSRETGGRLGKIKEKLLPSGIRKILNNLSVNEVSDPIINSQTIVLLKLNNREEKDTKSQLDYLVEFLIAPKNSDGEKLCKETSKEAIKSSLLSNLEKNKLRILKYAYPFELNPLDEINSLILCNRRVVGDINQINNKKANYFNQSMNSFSKKLMLELYREATIF